MATTKFSTIIGSAQVVPNFTDPAAVSVTMAATLGVPVAPSYTLENLMTKIRVKGVLTLGTTTGGAATGTLPNSHTAKTVGGTTEIIGQWWNNKGGAASVKRGTIFTTNNSATFSFGLDDNSNANSSVTAVSGTTLGASGDVIFFDFTVQTAAGLASGGYVAQGAGLATSLKPGIVYRSPQTALTVSGTGWTTTRAVGIAYMDNNGVWRMTFNIFGSVTSTARTIFGITVTGIVAKNVATLLQGIGTVANTVGTVPPSTGYIGANSNAMTCEHASATTVSYSFFGDIELESKPSWA